MNRRLFFWALTSSLAGFLFGFDTVVISGAEQSIEKLWELSPRQHGLTIGIALWGMVVGSFFGGWPTDHWGRKKTLISIGLLYFVSAVWSGLATDVTSFMIARFLGGLGVGISTVAAPLYIAEISPPDWRGRLAGMFQFNIVFGILIAFLSNALLEHFLDENAWRWMLGIEAIPAILYTLLCCGIPESPRWLIGTKGDHDEGLKVLGMINSEASESEIQTLAEEIKKSTQEINSSESLFTSRLKFPITLAFLVAFFNQLSGINAVLYFAPRIFGLTGIDREAALLQSVSIGFTNLMFTFVGLYMIDRFGRRTLLTIGSIGYILSLGIVGMTFLSYSPQFKVAAEAIALSEACESLQDSKTNGASEARIGKYQEAQTKAQAGLEAATKSTEYGGTAVEIPSDTSIDEQIAIAQQALSESAEASGLGGTIVLFGIFAFIASHAVGQGAVIWVFISEIFPNQFRAAGMALGCFTHWIFAALITTFFPIMVRQFAPGFIFLFFSGMMVLQLIWVKLMVPETKGVPLEEMQQRLGIE